jgi:hypothetical protein
MLRSILLLSLLFVVSCATNQSATSPATPAATPAAGKTMSEKFNGPAIKQNANGQWPDDVKKTSAFDSDRKSPYFTAKSSVAKPYQTGSYAKTSWWGKKQVPRQAYTGNTDGNRFRTRSNIQHGGAHETGATPIPGNAYPTSNLTTSTAHEQAAKRLAKPSDAETDVRRRVYPEPEVSSWKQQRAMDVKTTKSILGRE